MTVHTKNAWQKERDLRQEYAQPLFTMVEVRNILLCSNDFVYDLIREGDLEAVDINGRVRTREEISPSHYNGIRIKPSSLKAFLDRIELV